MKARQAVVATRELYEHGKTHIIIETLDCGHILRIDGRTKKYGKPWRLCSNCTPSSLKRQARQRR